MNPNHAERYRKQHMIYSVILATTFISGYFSILLNLVNLVQGWQRGSKVGKQEGKEEKKGWHTWKRMVYFIT